MFSQGFTGAFVALLASAQLATAHMEIKNPAPFRSKHNPNAVNIDYTNTAPLLPEGVNYPCKGYHQDLGTPAGKSVATYAPGSQYNFEVIGQAPHGGGSCQVSLSYDRGATFKVIQSYEGSCPLSSTYPFTIPSDAPEGEAIWAWTWSNKVGNREYYMNCAAVTISKGAAKRDAVVKRASIAFSERPPLFVANLETTTCKVPEGTDVLYPNAGPDVIKGAGNLVAPLGDCGPSGGNGGGNGGAAPPPPPSSSAQAPVVTPAPTPSKPASLPGGVFITVPGEASSSAAPVVTAPVETPAPAPTTLIVSTRPAAPTQGAGNGNGGGSTGGPAGAHAAGTPCTNEGAWNCVSGSGFQRCASGAWSPIISMAAGTKCTAGESDTLITSKKRRSFRHGHVHGSRHHA